MSRKRARSVEARIESLGSDGHGSVDVDGRHVRIKNALPGEVVEARVLKRRKGEWLAEAIAVSQASVDRVEPACAYFPRCGGCTMQHMDYPVQVALKQRQLMEALTQAGVRPCKVNAPTLGPRLGYRTKARFGVRIVSGEVLLGFRESFGNRVGRMDDCLTLTPRLAALIAPLKALIGLLSVPDRIPQVEVASGDSSCALILRHLDPLTDADTEAIGRFAAEQRVNCYGQSAGYDSLLRISTHADDVRCEPQFLSYGNPDFGIHFKFRPMDFTQVNLTMNRMLVRAAIAGLAAPVGSRVLDLFCGLGNFSLALAAAGHRVTGLEAAAESVERARLNARHNGLDGRCEFDRRDLYDADCLDLGVADCLLLDPPRSGAGPNLAAWVQTSGVSRIAYVSCSPQSFAEDARTLVREGFELEQVGIFDMFPHTAHVETLGVFRKRW